jgi:hypothetical protein
MKKRLMFFAALVVAAVTVVAGSAMAGGAPVKASVVYNSTVPNGPPANVPSIGPEAYAFDELGNAVTFAGTARRLTSVTVGLSSWACAQGGWNTGDCVTPTGATFPQAITFNIYEADGTTLIATKTQTFNVPYRPSASSKCTGPNAGKWHSSGLKQCFNGLYNEVTFSFSGVTLDNAVVYGIAYNTATAGYNQTGVSGPADSLNIALVNESAVSAGNDTALDTLWEAHHGSPFASTTEWAPLIPAVQFKAGS